MQAGPLVSRLKRWWFSWVSVWNRVLLEESGNIVSFLPWQQMLPYCCWSTWQQRI